MPSTIYLTGEGAEAAAMTALPGTLDGTIEDPYHFRRLDRFFVSRHGHSSERFLVAAGQQLILAFDAYFRMHGYDYVCFDDPNAALRYFAENRSDVVIAEARMRGGGLLFAQRVRALEAVPLSKAGGMQA